jgi:hypothetical protein
MLPPLLFVKLIFFMVRSSSWGSNFYRGLISYSLERCFPQSTWFVSMNYISNFSISHSSLLERLGKALIEGKDRS